jgi:hypothetical protein
MRNKVGIVVPYRDRLTHLQTFLSEIKKYFENQTLRYTVIVVEQDDAVEFNRGMLCNIGFIEAKKRLCSHVVFHDVDMIPIDVDYSYSEHPVHLATDDLPFESYFGGITLFPIDVFEKINGFSNLYWGWGFEDDDLRYRCVRHGVPFKTHLEPVVPDKIVPIYNGTNAYATIPNVINFLRDVTIEIDIELDRIDYNPDKASDTFPIFNLKGYDLQISFTSFNRIYFQVFHAESAVRSLEVHTVRAASVCSL